MKQLNKINRTILFFQPKRTILVSFLLFFFTFLLFSKKTLLAQVSSNCPQGTVLNVVAHEDDDLLFLSPALLHNIQNGKCVTTVFLTAGDNGQDSSYWMGRENGSKAAYAQMLGVANNWTQNILTISGHQIISYTLNPNSNISLLFFRLPDGTIDGGGWAIHNYESLKKLWQNTITTIHAIDGSTSYTRQDLIDTLTATMNTYTPDEVHTQDYVNGFVGSEHSDHTTAAYFTQAASQQYVTPHILQSYEGYIDQNQPQNVFDPDQTNKENIFLTYAQFDSNACQTAPNCDSSSYGAWLRRQYILDTSGQLTPTPSQTPAATPTVTPTVTATPTPTQPPSGNNVAPLATVTASTENTTYNQQAVKAVDGYTDGYPNGDYTHEWASVNETAGAWLKLAWSSPQTISQIVLYDRPNLSDQITAGTLVFSDGTSITTGTLNNDGTPVTYTFPQKTVTSVRLNITATSSTTMNIGLAEIQVFTATSGTPTPTPTNTITPTPTNTIVPTPTSTPFPTVTPTSVPTPTNTPIPTPTSPSTTTVTFDDLNLVNQPLNGQYPTSIINWGTNVFAVSPPFREFTTNSIYFYNYVNNATFNFVTPRKLASIDVDNQDPASTVVKITCRNGTTNPYKKVTVPASTVMTINTSTVFSTTCNSVNLYAANGQSTNFDNLVIQ